MRSRLSVRVPHLHHLLLGLTLAAGTSGCQASRGATPELIAEIDAAHRAELYAFQAEQERLRSTVDLSTVRDFGPNGQLHLREVELIGWPGSAFLRVEYTYVNTGALQTASPRVTLAVADVDGVQHSVTQDLVLPLGVHLGRDSTYSTWLELPVGDIYQRLGWRWDIRIEPRE